ncbi:MAG: hypothetical protein JNM76_14805 [Betaproteobacteria bacterium]|nr:hypothetical protein [Betaproteobacteria bacterium]
MTGFCPTCNEFRFSDRHECPPIFEARLEDWGDDHWREVRAQDAERAAEKFCQDRDSNSGDYTIAREGSAIVFVRGADGTVGKYDITVEAVPEYSAHLVETLPPTAKAAA